MQNNCKQEAKKQRLCLAHVCHAEPFENLCEVELEVGAVQPVAPGLQRARVECIVLLVRLERELELRIFCWRAVVVVAQAQHFALAAAVQSILIAWLKHQLCILGEPAHQKAPAACWAEPLFFAACQRAH